MGKQVFWFKIFTCFALNQFLFQLASLLKDLTTNLSLLSISYKFYPSLHLETRNKPELFKLMDKTNCKIHNWIIIRILVQLRSSVSSVRVAPPAPEMKEKLTRKIQIGRFDLQSQNLSSKKLAPLLLQCEGIQISKHCTIILDKLVAENRETSSDNLSNTKRLL